MAKKKKSLTEEQLHKIRSAAAKKAAKTRKANILEAVKKAKAAEKRAKTLEKKRKARMEEAYQRNLAAKKQTEKWKKRSEAAKKGWETRRTINRAKKVLKHFQDAINSWAPEPRWSQSMQAMKTADKNSLDNMLKNAIANYGEEEVAKRLEKDGDIAMNYAYEILWDSKQEAVESAKAHLLTILNQGPLDANSAKKVAEQLTKEEMEQAQSELDFLLG